VSDSLVTAVGGEFQALAAAINNWGRWGPNDQRGTLNLLDPAGLANVAADVTGRSIPLAIPLSPDGPQLGFVRGRTNPERTMVAVHEPLGDPDGVRFNDDAVSMGLQAATHWDALAHVSYGGRMWNGVPTSAVTAAGATRLGAETLGSIAGTAVLLDVAAALGVGRLEGGSAISGDDLDAAAEFGRVSVRPGDIVLVRTGQVQHLHAGDRMSYAIATAGPSLASVRWFRDHDVAAVATDNLSFEVFPGERDGLALPVHMLHIVEMGLVQGQNFDLEALAADCADDGRYRFLLVATPEPFVGGCGAPVAPLVLK
jgi:kynurenine formamidase